jgi:biotin carboxyl carrier protein
VTVEVEIAGHSRRVEVEQSPNGWVVTIDGRRQTLDAARAPGGWSLLIGDRAYDVSLHDRGQGELTVYVSGQAIDARVNGPSGARAYRRRGASGTVSQSGARQIVAPMPGRIVKVLVRTGDQVVARQGLVVVEAMNMENELRAPADAVVRDIRVTEGASVEAGAVLVVLE